MKPSWSGVEFAYAVGRSTGSAVARNRLKRRLRAIVFETAPTLPTGAYVVRAGSDATVLGFEELKAAMNEALEKATRRAAADQRTPSLQGATR
jgi:ribonuclease P protein component